MRTRSAADERCSLDLVLIAGMEPLSRVLSTARSRQLRVCRAAYSEQSAGRARLVLEVVAGRPSAERAARQLDRLVDVVSVHVVPLEDAAAGPARASMRDLDGDRSQR